LIENRKDPLVRVLADTIKTAYLYHAMPIYKIKMKESTYGYVIGLIPSHIE